MSFGFGVGVGDIALIGNTLYQVSQQLNGEAVKEFRECRNTCRRFVQVANLYESLLDRYDHSIVRDLYRDMRKILSKFDHTIKNQEIYLGRKGEKWSFRSVLAKIQWSKHSKALDKLRRDLESRIQLMNTAIQVIRLTRAGSSQHQPQEPRLILADASGRELSVPFSEVPTWADLHRIVLRLYQRSEALAVIENWSYVFHNTTTRQDIIPSSPVLKSPRKLVADDERLEMSVILPVDLFPTTHCPNCRRRWALLQLAEVTCRRCGLWVKIYDSFEDEPDSLTKLALETIRSNGEPATSVERKVNETPDTPSSLRQFVTGFLNEIKPYHSQHTTANSNEEDAKRQIFDNFPRLRTPGLHDIRQERFRRIRLCSPNWPVVSIPASLERANGLLRETMEGVDRAHEAFSQCPDAPFDAAAWAIGALHQKDLGPLLDCMRSARTLHRKRRQSKQVGIMRTYLEHYSEGAQLASNPFGPAALRVRCMSWILSEVSRFEENLIRHAVHKIQRSSLWVPPGYVRPGTSLGYKLFSIPHIALLPIWRCTFDVAEDLVRAVFFPGPPADFAALFMVVVGSERVSLDYIMDGHCKNSNWSLLTRDPSFSKALCLGTDLLKGWEIRYRDALNALVVSAATGLGGRRRI